MNHEFNNRIEAQRSILKTINSIKWREDLSGLSTKAIERWILVNRLESESQLAQLIVQTSGKLFFLANKSQEQVSDDYRRISSELGELQRAIHKEIRQTFLARAPE